MATNKPSYNKESLIYNLYNKVQAYGYFVRNSNSDGLESWNAIKSLFEKKNFQDIRIQWNDELFRMYEFLTNERNGYGINDIEKEDSDDENLWKINHFFLQHVRIPYKNKQGNIMRLMQVAYNSGQMIASKNEYDKYGLHKYISYYHNYDMANMDTYVKWKDVNELKISDDDVKHIILNIDKLYTG